METAVSDVLAWLEQMPAFLLFSAMFTGAVLEYVIPPVPGDLWTAAGAVLVARGHSFWTVFLGVNLGSLVGSMIDYAFGAWLADPRRRFRTWGPRWERTGRGIDRIARGFERHTALYLVANRFLPGVRAFFFIAAGFARVPVWKAAVFGFASSVLWNLLLIGLGYAAGKNLERILDWLQHYTWVVWGLLGLWALWFLLRVFVRRRGEKEGGRQEP